MARPTEFDREEVLGDAIQVFARHGFAAASTTELLDKMGISRQSLYGAFGDKRRLFLEALKAYSDKALVRLCHILEQKDDSLAALEAGLLLDLACGGGVEMGCLGVGSITEFGRTDRDVTDLNEEAGRKVVEAFAARIRTGMADGEIRAGLNPEKVAQMLLTLKSGLKIAARGGATEDEVRESARLVLEGLSAH